MIVEGAAKARRLSEARTRLPGYRDVVVWPFSRSSIWNTPINDGAAYVDTNMEVRGPKNARAGLAIEGTYGLLDPDAPWRPVHFVDTGGKVFSSDFAERCGSAVTESDILRLPVAPHWTNRHAQGVGGGGNACSIAMIADDMTFIYGLHPMSVCLDADGGSYITCHYPFQLPRQRSLDWLRANKRGNLFDDGRRGGHGGTGLSEYGGSLHPGELTAGAHPVVNGVQTGPRHALKCTTNSHLIACRAIPHPTGGAAYRWPAFRADDGATRRASCTPRYASPYSVERAGNLRAIPRDDVLHAAKGYDLAGLQSRLRTTPARMLAWTLQHFGIYQVEDVGGEWPKFGIAARSGPEIGFFNEAFEASWGYRFDVSRRQTSENSSWWRDVKLLLQHLWIVDDNGPADHPGGAYRPGGKGLPLTALAPPFRASAVPASLRPHLVAAGEAEVEG